MQVDEYIVFGQQRREMVDDAILGILGIDRRPEIPIEIPVAFPLPPGIRYRVADRHEGQHPAGEPPAAGREFGRHVTDRADAADLVAVNGAGDDQAGAGPQRTKLEDFNGVHGA